MSDEDGLRAPISPADLSLLAAELGEIAASVDGVVHVRARPGFGSVVRSALQGLSTVVGGGGVVGSTVQSDDSVAAEAGASAASDVPDAERADPASAEAAAPGRPVPLVGIAVADLETRITLDIAVDESGSGPLVARAVAQALLDRVSGEPVPPASVDLRIVSVATGA
ncbi:MULTISPECIES: hypothetical protein [unclassified Frigoribacterium]|uniref:hypothetical protein n=1 Tax=unclassified Frigoribacterium TaxID=2627005 RepID=UPI0006FC8E4F|nr:MULTISPECIES: hypothetical protein [unclassified Frigoribacterium]KQO48348.1 hypothetical protein ASF07_13635 [Frigoribacterium sp. Leaf254]KQT40439.1 hypothetical protein ASG28_13640 [Frigoribacterium sp. Leaf415]OII24960.1 hypothetical protein BIV04_15730 [Frigoribacterium sp. MCBA15_019]